MQAFGTWHTGELLGFDLETTGVDPFNDVPVSYAFVRMSGGTIESHQASLVDPGRPIPQPATAVHGITDERARAEGTPLADAVVQVTGALLEASRLGVPVVGMKLDFDLTMIDACLRRDVGGGLVDVGFAGPVIDALVLDRHFDCFRKGRRTLGDLCAHYGVSIGHAHDAAADAAATLGVVSAMCSRFPDLCTSTAEDLYWAQMDWHREWSQSLSRWRLREGMLPLDAHDGEWPIAVERGSLEELARVAG